MAKAPTNVAQSFKDRLLNIARKEGRAFVMRADRSKKRERAMIDGGEPFDSELRGDLDAHTECHLR